MNLSRFVKEAAKGLVHAWDWGLHQEASLNHTLVKVILVVIESQGKYLAHMRSRVCHESFMLTRCRALISQLTPLSSASANKRGYVG